MVDATECGSCGESAEDGEAHCPQCRAQRAVTEAWEKVQDAVNEALRCRTVVRGYVMWAAEREAEGDATAAAYYRGRAVHDRAYLRLYRRQIHAARWAWVNAVYERDWAAGCCCNPVDGTHCVRAANHVGDCLGIGSYVARPEAA